MKACSLCRTERPFEDFWKSRSTGDGYATWCKACYKDRKASGVWPSQSGRHRKSAYMKNRYGLTLDQLDAMAHAQDGRCAICEETPQRRLVVDHCHTSGRVRGLLCHRCNVQLAPLERDGGVWLIAAQRYLAGDLSPLASV